MTKKSETTRNMPSMAKIIDYWAAQPATETVCYYGNHLGWGEPFCFGCGWLPPLATTADRSEAWNDANSWLDRAHLQDHAHAQNDHPSNIVPLCHLCHKDMPQFTSARSAKAWIKLIPHKHWSWQAFTDRARLHRPRDGVNRNTTLFELRRVWAEGDQVARVETDRILTAKAALLNGDTPNLRRCRLHIRQYPEFGDTHELIEATQLLDVSTNQRIEIVMRSFRHHNLLYSQMLEITQSQPDRDIAVFGDLLDDGSYDPATPIQYNIDNFGWAFIDDNNQLHHPY